MDEKKTFHSFPKHEGRLTMYGDLVKRLKEEADCPDNYPEDSCLMREAADAIEDLARRLEENPVSIRFTKEDKQMILEYRKEVDAIDARAAVMNAVSLALDHDDWMPKSDALPKPPKEET